MLLIDLVPVTRADFEWLENFLYRIWDVVSKSEARKFPASSAEYHASIVEDFQTAPSLVKRQTM